MNSWNSSHLKRNAVYGLPTLWGMMMFLMIGTALWLSIFQQSPVDRWIAFLMIVFVLLHLAEANSPFRFLEFTVFPVVPPFQDLDGRVKIEIYNPTVFASTELRLRLKGQSLWTEVPPLPSRSRCKISLELPPAKAGRHHLPALSVESSPATRLFRLWKVLKSDLEFLVLPAATDHGIPAGGTLKNDAEPELSHVESILDERLLSKMDHKLFLKTGKAYYRKSEIPVGGSSIRLDWFTLKSLSEIGQREQFASWIRMYERLDQPIHSPLRSRAGSRRQAVANSEVTNVVVATPFLHCQSPAPQLNWDDLKFQFAEWLYGQH